MRKSHIYCHIFFAFSLLWPSAYAIAQVVAKATYTVMDQGLGSVTIEVTASNLTDPTIIFVPLPFRAILKPISQTGIIGITHREKYSVALILLEPNKLSEHLIVNMDPSQPVENGVRISQTPLGTALIIPRIAKDVINDISLFTRAKGTASVSSFSSIEATFSKNFELYSGTGGTTITKLDHSETVALSLDSTGQHYCQFFKAPGAQLVEYMEKGVVRAIAVILGLFVAFMAPGFIPHQYFGRVILSTIGLLIIILVVRWWVSGPSKNSFVSAVSDTIAIVICIIGLGIVWVLRRMSTRSAQAPVSQIGS